MYFYLLKRKSSSFASSFVSWLFRGRLCCKYCHHSTAGMGELDNDVSNGNAGQCFNPAFVHAIAVPEVDMTWGLNKVCAVARGDGTVDVINLEAELASMNSKNSLAKGSRSRSRRGEAQSSITPIIGERKSVQLDYNLGGHTAGVSCV